MSSQIMFYCFDKLATKIKIKALCGLYSIKATTKNQSWAAALRLAFLNEKEKTTQTL
jgi:hypothetical protein